MAKLTRRDMISLGLLTAGGMSLSGCCTLLDIVAPDSPLKEKHCNPFQDWKDEASFWWEERQDQHQQATAGGDRPEMENRFSFLMVGKRTPYLGSYAEQARGKKLNEWFDQTIVIENHGNVTSWNTVVEIYQDYSSKAKDGVTRYEELNLFDKYIISVHPGEIKQFTFPWRVTIPTQGYFCVRVYDPVWDFPEMVVQRNQHRKHSGGIWLDFEKETNW